jgi:hypothetical protein
MTQQIGWAGVARMGLVQACMGAVVVLTTSTTQQVVEVSGAGFTASGGVQLTVVQASGG